MKALHFNEHGGIEKLRYGEIDDPRPAADEVVVRVKACALNHLDLWVLAGWAGLNLPLPHVGGADISGVITVCGKGVSGLKAGMRVVVNPGIAGAEDEWTKRGEDSVSPAYTIISEDRRGGFAEFVSVPAKNIIELPDRVGFSEGAAPLLVGLTAWRMLKTRGELCEGETLLIIGAGGGLNSLSIQLACLLGAKVIALTSSDEKAKKARALGAAEIINYRKTPDWGKEVLKLTSGRGVDLVVDNVGAATIPQSLLAVRRGGRIVTVGNTSGGEVRYDNRRLFRKQVSIIGSTMGSRQDLDAVLNLLWHGKLKPVIETEIALPEGARAYQMLKAGTQFGKIILIPA